jgi:hypothetical protein
MPTLATGHPDIAIITDSWHAWRDDALLETIGLIAEHLAPAVAHVTGRPIPITSLQFTAPSLSAWTVEAVAHRTLIGPQPLHRVLRHTAHSWWLHRTTQARTTLYYRDSALILLNPLQLRAMTHEELVRTLGHELVHAVQLTAPGAALAVAADLRNDYGVHRHSPLQRARADAVVAHHEVDAYFAEDAIWRAYNLAETGELPQPAEPAPSALWQPWDLADSAELAREDLADAPPQRVLEELRLASPVSEIADWVRELSHALADVDGHQVASERLLTAWSLLATAAEEIGEAGTNGTYPDEDTEAFTGLPGDIDQVPDPDPVTTPTRRPVPVG